METKQTKTIWDLELHEELCINSLLSIMRVGSGWLYKHSEYRVEYGNYELVQVVFVPYTNTYPIKN